MKKKHKHKFYPLELITKSEIIDNNDGTFGSIEKEHLLKVCNCGLTKTVKLRYE